MKPSPNLSDFELHVMQCLWDVGEATTPELHESMRERNVAYSTIRTVVDRLEKKGAIRRSRRDGRAVSFMPVLKQKQVSSSMLTRLRDRLFNGEPRSLVSHLVENEALDREDIRYLQDLLNRKQSQLQDDRNQPTSDEEER